MPTGLGSRRLFHVLIAEIDARRTSRIKHGDVADDKRRACEDRDIPLGCHVCDGPGGSGVGKRERRSIDPTRDQRPNLGPVPPKQRTQAPFAAAKFKPARSISLSGGG